MQDNSIQCKPSVDKFYLLLLSGLMWEGVGIMLCTLAYGWLKNHAGLEALLLGVMGIGAALLVHFFGFSKLAAKNINRIMALEDSPCLFAFQSRKSYLNIAVMMSIGIILRRSSVHKPYLAVLYITIGGALFLSGWRYFKALRNYLKGKEPRGIMELEVEN